MGRTMPTECKHGVVIDSPGGWDSHQSRGAPGRIRRHTGRSLPSLTCLDENGREVQS